MERKYDCWFCRCGRVHIMPDSYWNELKDPNRRILRFCLHCGATKELWLEEYEDGYCCCSMSIDKLDLTSEQLMNYHLVASHGIMVPLEEGGYADYQAGGMWFDDRGNKSKVNAKRLIREVKDPEILHSIAGYANGIDWRGTEYNLY